MLLVAISLLTATVLGALWYWLSVRYTRRRAGEVSRWIESALAGQGHVTGIRWLTSSRFQIPLRLGDGMFRRASMLMDMTRSEFPFAGLGKRSRAKHEMLTFQADLDLPPVFSLHVENFRWYARSSRKVPKNDRGWIFQQTSPLVLSTRPDWHKEISLGVMSLAQGHNHDFLTVDFQRHSPHFSVTFPLESIAPGAPTRTCLFESMRELASNSSASRP